VRLPDPADGLILRRWNDDDAAALIAAAGDPLLHRWTRVRAGDDAEARRWLDAQHTGWANGSRYSFAVLDERQRLLANVALKRRIPAEQVPELALERCDQAEQVADAALRRRDPGEQVADIALKPPYSAEQFAGVALARRDPPEEAAEVGYWTAGYARGQGVAPRAVRALSGWAFSTFPALHRLDLLHHIDNTASCRVAVKSGYPLDAVVSRNEPDLQYGHLHRRGRPSPRP
jgi:RimJ/RimL family protein N-acetyltransferase